VNVIESTSQKYKDIRKGMPGTIKGYRRTDRPEHEALKGMSNVRLWATNNKE
jgi:hypothetical protein